jgi:hypothetical protein
MRGTVVPIPFLGMNNQLLNDQSVDGLCDSIINLKPKGTLERPYWAPFEKINRLKNSAGTDFTYAFGIPSITDAFYQVRNHRGQFSIDPVGGSLKRLLVLSQSTTRKVIDIIDPITWAVVKTQALPNDGSYTWSCTRLDEVTVISISKDKVPYLLYYLLDDVFVNSGWIDTPKITFTTEEVALTTVQVEAGDTQGVIRESTDQWFLASWAFRLFDGGHVKHQAPILVKVPQIVTATPNFSFAYKPIFTLVGYTESEKTILNLPFWKALIAGISLSVTIPRNNEQEALNDGAFFEVGYFSRIDRLAQNEWPTADDPNIITVNRKSDDWPTGRKIGIDNFTHHRIPSRTAFTYNKRILLGGSAVDFVLPKVQSTAFTGTIPAGTYIDYMSYVQGGTATVARSYWTAAGVQTTTDDPEYSYDVFNTTYNASFIPLAGRDFKTVVVLASSLAQGTTQPPVQPTFYPRYTQLVGIAAGKLDFYIQTNQTTFQSPSGQFTGQNPWLDIELTVGPIESAADQTLNFRVFPLGNVPPIMGFSGFQLLSGATTGTFNIYHRITIKTDSGTFYRVLTSQMGDTEAVLNLPSQIWYPDRRATRYELIVQKGATLELFLDKDLIQHPESNYSYIFLSALEQSLAIATVKPIVPILDLTVNNQVQYVPNRIRASVSSNGFIFDPAATYRVGNSEQEIVLGFALNLNPTSEGQAGQYPLYVFTDKGVYALEQTGDPNIAFGRITPVSNFNGINNPYAITNAGSLIIACDNKYIYALAGLESTRIDDQIANDPDYKDYLKQIRIGFHRASDYEELIFSNPFFDYSLCYNLKYKVWYKATERYKFFFYDYPELLGLTTDNVLKDFSSKNELSPVAWSLISRVIQYQQPYVFKRLFPSIVRMALKQPTHENSASYFPVRVTLMGYKDDQTIVYTLYDQSIKTDHLYDPRIYNQFGSMYAYRVILSGTNYHRQAQIQGLDTDVEFRYETTRRRFNGSSQYLFTLGQLGISIVNSPVGEFKNYYVHPGIITTELFNLPASVHGFTREPDVTLRDADGYTFEAPVRVNKDTFDITILVNPATPYRVLLT